MIIFGSLMYWRSKTHWTPSLGATKCILSNEGNKWGIDLVDLFLISLCLCLLLLYLLFCHFCHYYFEVVVTLSKQLENVIYYGVFCYCDVILFLLLCVSKWMRDESRETVSDGCFSSFGLPCLPTLDLWNLLSLLRELSVHCLLRVSITALALR